ncbi:Potassium voltage-gated channel protein Shab [Paragonimus heterotremus]|uniref:Potassium voltage-gated channel protein Shab n=1 Tax=Paragonimus heterotremus TaxID=100268 RepID=A0A8J4T5B5_9TREM|nr:Potassium voltage-gated channel protein Shab [Paragonimus heterotremus]
MFGQIQSTGKSGDMICLCVGGRLFITRRATLYRLPDSRLYLIATQGSSCQTSSNYSPFALNESYLKPCQPSTSPLSATDSYVGTPTVNLSEKVVVGGATILPASVSTMLAGNMNLKSASALCRNRGSVAPGVAPQTPVTPGGDLNCSINLTVPTTVQVNGQMLYNTNPFQPAPPVVYFYDRDPEIFRFVLDYYRTGELHLPSSICGPFVRKELIFWGIDESLIGPCCMPAYMRYDEEKRTKNTLFRDCFEDIDSMQNLVKYSRGWKKWRYQMWLFMDHPSSSLPAKIWASCLLVLMIASVMCYCLSTHEVFRTPSTVMHSLQRKSMSQSQTTAEPPTNSVMLRSDTDDRNEQEGVRSASDGTLERKLQNTTSLLQTSSNSTETEQSAILTVCLFAWSETNPKMDRDCATEPAHGLVLADIALNCLFTTEFILKILLAPDKPKFLSSIVSILDIIILSSYWVYMALFYSYYYIPKSKLTSDEELREQLSGYLWLMNILSMTQAMRITRIFKISKISRILRVLILTVKKSIPELVLLGFLLMNGMFLFSCLIYMAEYRVNDTFPNIPQSFWWSIITLTAVGYGDMHPKGGAGYFVGSVTAICGCIVTGLAIPIIGNNFNTYYKYMKNQLMEDKYLKTLRKDMESTGNSGTKSGIGAAADKSGLPLPGRKPRQNIRPTIRARAAHRGLRQKLDRVLHLNTDSFRHCFTGRQKGNTRNNKTNLRRPNTDSMQPLTENQRPSMNFASRRSIIETIIQRDQDITMSNITSTFITPNPYRHDGTDREPRPSLIHPLATNNMLNSLTPSRLSLLNTPQIWVDGDDAEEAISITGGLFPINETTASVEDKMMLEDNLELMNHVQHVKIRQSVVNAMSPRNSYQEVDFIPTWSKQMDMTRERRQSKSNSRFSLRTTTNTEQGEKRNNIVQPTHDHDTAHRLVEKRKNYV